MWLLPFLLISVIRSLAVFAEPFTRTDRYRPVRVLMTLAETRLIALTTFVVFATETGATVGAGAEIDTGDARTTWPPPPPEV